MVAIRIRHNTTYRYRYPVDLGPHRLMLRPRESRDLRLVSCDITSMPQATISWAQDVFGNAVATANYHAPTDHLSIDSLVDLHLNAQPWPVYDVAGTAQRYPFLYGDDEWTDLGAMAIPQYYDPQGRLQAWAREFVQGDSTDTLALLKDLSSGVSTRIWYQSRDDEGTQTPLATIDRGWGSCRDFAVLFVEAARSLGFGARVVSGYLHNPDRRFWGTVDAGSTHAWAEAYVPGAGWITFDPTNRSFGGYNLIPVAVARGIAQVVPVAGSFWGMTDAFISMQVTVSVEALA